MIRNNIDEGNKKEALTRLNSFVRKDQKAFIKKFSATKGMTEGEIVREAVDNFIKKNTPKK